MDLLYGYLAKSQICPLGAYKIYVLIRHTMECWIIVIPVKITKTTVGIIPPFTSIIVDLNYMLCYNVISRSDIVYTDRL